MKIPLKNAKTGFTNTQTIDKIVGQQVQSAEPEMGWSKNQSGQGLTNQGRGFMYEKNSHKHLTKNTQSQK